jgi:hypothetical protein
MADFTAARRIALVLPKRLGDSLIMMPLANSLRREGRAVTVFSDRISDLKRWFPGFDIRAVPAPEQAPAAFADYEVVAQMYADRPLAAPAAQDGRFSCFDDWRVAAAKRPASGRENLRVYQFGAYAAEVFGIRSRDIDNGSRPPEGLRYRRHSERVIIHPTAGNPRGYWPREKYARLAAALVARGFVPQFVVEPWERADWLGQGNTYPFQFVETASLDELADYIHESGWLIGSDSGVGHLASSCRIPTLTICERPRNMRGWLPAWSPAAYVRPIWLPTSGLRNRFWREATPVWRVLRAFDALRARDTHASSQRYAAFPG